MSKYSQHNGNRVMSVAAVGAFSTMRVAVANIILVALALMFFVGYLAMNNQAASSSFRIRALERQVSDLRDAQKKLDLETAGKQALGNIEDKVDSLGLVPVTSIRYVNPEGGNVALK